MAGGPGVSLVSTCWLVPVGDEKSGLGARQGESGSIGLAKVRGGRLDRGGRCPLAPAIAMAKLSIATSTIRHSSGGTETVLTARGELDGRGGVLLGREVVAAAGGGGVVSIDLSAVASGDLAGLRAMLGEVEAAGVGGVVFRNHPAAPGGAFFSRTPMGGGVVLASINGDLDRRGTEAVGQCVAALCGVSGVRVLLDLSGVGMIVSLGVGVLISGLKSVVAGGGRMFFLNPSPIVSTSLEFSGLERYVFRGSVEAAVARICGD